MTPTQSSTITLQRWLELVRPVLEDVSDRAFQERAWFNKGPEVSSPTELICQLGDYQFSKTYQEPSFDLSTEQRAACARFADMVEAFKLSHNKRFDEHEVIDNPDWEKIRVAAANLLKILPS